MKMWEDMLDEMRRIQEEIERAFSNFYTKRAAPEKGEKTAKTGTRMPATDVYETENNVIVAAELPGIDKKDIALNITGNEIEIRAEKKQEKEQKGKGFYKFAAARNQFYRRMTLPAEVKPEKAKAEYKNGLLRVEIPKTKKAAKKKKIEIQ